VFIVLSFRALIIPSGHHGHARWRCEA